MVNFRAAIHVCLKPMILCSGLIGVTQKSVLVTTEAAHTVASIAYPRLMRTWHEHREHG